MVWLKSDNLKIGITLNQSNPQCNMFFKTAVTTVLALASSVANCQPRSGMVISWINKVCGHGLGTFNFSKSHLTPYLGTPDTSCLFDLVPGWPGFTGK